VVVLQLCGNILADGHLVQMVDDGLAFEEEDAADEFLGVLHLVLGAAFGGLVEAVESRGR
jgi:hypothetical protein